MREVNAIGWRIRFFANPEMGWGIGCVYLAQKAGKESRSLHSGGIFHEADILGWQIFNGKGGKWADKIAGQAALPLLEANAPIHVNTQGSFGYFCRGYVTGDEVMGRVAGNAFPYRLRDSDDATATGNGRFHVGNDLGGITGIKMGFVEPAIILAIHVA